MSASEKRPGSIAFLLAGSVLLLLCVAGLAISFAPIIHCPQMHSTMWHQLEKDCPRCHGTLRISLLNKWYWQPTASKLLAIEGGHGTLEAVSQDRTAEETLKKIEGTFQEALTISVKVKEAGVILVRGEENRISYSTEMLLAKGNKVFISDAVTSSDKGTTRETEMVSDGARFSITYKGAERGSGQLNPVPAYLKNRLTASLVFMEPYCVSQLMRMMMDPTIPEVDSDVKGSLRISDLNVSKDENGAQTLSFHYQTNGARFAATPEGNVTLWYDPKTYRLLKRSFSGMDRTLMFTYDEFTLNAVIPDEKFKLPEEKK